MAILLGAGARKRVGCMFLCVVLMYATSGKKALRPFDKGDPGHKEAVFVSNILGATATADDWSYLWLENTRVLVDCRTWLIIYDRTTTCRFVLKKKKK